MLNKKKATKTRIDPSIHTQAGTGMDGVPTSIWCYFESILPLHFQRLSCLAPLNSLRNQVKTLSQVYTL